MAAAVRKKDEWLTISLKCIIGVRPVWTQNLAFPRNDSGNGSHIFTSVHCASLLVRRNILHLYFGLYAYNTALFSCMRQCR